MWGICFCFIKTITLPRMVWKSSSMDCIASFFIHGRRYGGNGGLFGTLLIMDYNLGLHHVQWKTIVNKHAIGRIENFHKYMNMNHRM
jgi:hypothetical protein